MKKMTESMPSRKRRISSFLVWFFFVPAFAFANDNRDEKIGGVGAYERSFTLAAQECLANLTTTEMPATNISCEVTVQKETEEDIQIPNKGKKVWFDVIKENPREREKYKDAKVRIHAVGNLNGYRIYLESYIVREGQIIESGPRITLSEFEYFLNQLIEKEGKTLKIRLLKVEGKP